MIHKQSSVCKCGHSMMVHIIRCWGKDCSCKGFEEKEKEASEVIYNADVDARSSSYK